MSPREPRPFVVFGFRTTHEALEAEHVLKSAGMGVVPVPTPAVLGELCGIALRLEPEQADPARAVLAAAGITPEAAGEVLDV